MLSALIVWTLLLAPPPGRQRSLGASDLEQLRVCSERPAPTRDIPLAGQLRWRRLGGGDVGEAAGPRADPYLWLPDDGGLPEGHLLLSFDDGPDRRATPRIRAVLAACGIRAHFFVPGTRLVGPGGAWARTEVTGLVAEGHVVGSHSHRHPSFSRQLLFRKQRHREIQRGHEHLRRALGAPVDLFRLPYGDGADDSVVLLAVWEMGLVNMHWNLRSGDTRDLDTRAPGFQGLSPARLQAQVMRSLERSRRAGERLGHGIVTFHDTNYRTALMLPALLGHLVAEGYTFVRLVGPAISRQGEEPPSRLPPRPGAGLSTGSP